MNGMGKNSAKIHNVKWYFMSQFTTLMPFSFFVQKKKIIAYLNKKHNVE